MLQSVGLWIHICKDNKYLRKTNFIIANDLINCEFHYKRNADGTDKNFCILLIKFISY